MSDRVSIKASGRSGSPRGVRAQGMVPGVMYGHGVDTTSVAVDEREFGKVLKDVGLTTLLSVDLEGNDHQVLIREVQHHPVTNRVLHVDFYQVKMDEVVKAEVPLVFEGVSLAVKDQGGVLVRSADTIEVEALPAHLPHDIKVDISSLVDFDTAVHVKDLPVPEEVTVLRDGEDLVATVQAPRTAEELEQLDEEVSEDVESVEGVEDKAEGEEGETTEADDSEAEKPAEESTE